MIMNPFKFGNPVTGSYYLSHPDLEKSVLGFIENKVPVVIWGPRRFGKTSFVLKLIGELEKKSKVCLFIDVFNITSLKDFLSQLIRGMIEKQPFFEKMKNKLKDYFSHITSKITAEVHPQTGMPTSFSLSFLNNASERDVKEAIQDVLGSFEKLGSHVVVAIDEFQKITEIDDNGWLEGTLRTYMQRLKNTSFIFTGSRKSLIFDMLNNSSRPFYRSCQPVDFPAFGNEFTDWIIGKFDEVDIHCDYNAIQHLRKLVSNTPNYVQMVCFHLVAQDVKNVNKDQVDTTLSTVVKQNAYAYQTLLNSLTLTQQRVLRLAAKENKQIFSKDLLKKYEISSGAALASALKALKEKQILDEGGKKGSVTFDDPLFAIWLKMEFRE
jgi:uncharacterized protein